jgi:uncharacterized protein
MFVAFSCTSLSSRPRKPATWTEDIPRASAVRDLLNGKRDVGGGLPRDIAAREAEADELTREVLTALRRTFITPLDRGDIKDLITSMDDAIDQMNQTARTITLFELRSFERPMHLDLCGAGTSLPARC